MTVKKKLGADPFKGIGSLLSDAPSTHDTQHVQDAPNTHDTQEVQHTHDTQGSRKQKRPRINMAFDPDNLKYIQVMASLQGISATAYVNQLIGQDRVARAETYKKARELQEGIR